MCLRLLLWREGLESSQRANALPCEIENRRHVEIQPPWAQTFLNWSPLWMIEVIVAMFRLVQGICSAQ